MQASESWLETALTHDRLGHAYLLVGRGAPAHARAFLQRLYCPISCGECPNCYKLAHGSHPDVHWLRKTDKRVGIDQIRELQRDALYPPSESEHKVYVIEEAEVLSIEAQNSLLKLLEEPPAYVTFLLLARRLRLLPTILSRCQMVKIPTVSRTELEEDMRARGFSDEELDWLAAFIHKHPGHLAQIGSDELTPGLLAEARQWRSELAELEDQTLIQALERAEHPLHRHEAILELLQRLPHKRAHEILELALLMSKLELECLADFMEEAISWYRDLFLLSRGQTARVWNVDHRESLAAELSRCRPDHLGQLIADLERSQADFEGNANRQLLVESCLFKMASASA